jgi:outer membrane protein TolC
MVLMLAAATPAAGQLTPALTLEDAERLAIEQSRPVAIARLDVDKAGYDLDALRLRRRPNIDVQALSGSLVAPLNLVFPTASLGTYPTTGPIPATDTSIRSDPRFATFMYARVAQPLTQLRTIGWGERVLGVGRDIAREQVRLAEAGIRAQVRKAYFGLLQAQDGLGATQEALALYDELERLMIDYLEREVVLRGDVLEIQATRARHEHMAQTLQSTIDTLHEQLNLLMGRDISTAFSVLPVAEPDVSAEALDTAETRALAQRPEVRQARLRRQQAEYDVERARSELIPEVSAVFNYFGFYNVEVLPRNVAAVGIYVKWEPFDWGRRGAEQATRRVAMEQAAQGVIETQEAVRVEVRQHIRRVRDARAGLRVRDLELRTARERLRVATERFRGDAGLRREVLEAQAATAGAEQQYHAALAEYWSARADLDKATGEAT